MKTIRKFELQTMLIEQVIPAPITRVLSVGLDARGIPCLWAEVDTALKARRVRVFRISTELPMPDVPALKLIGRIREDCDIWHIYTTFAYVGNN